MIFRVCCFLSAFLLTSDVALLQAQSLANFVPLAPCRAVDTREAGKGVLGAPALHAAAKRDFPLLQSSCGLPSAAVAYALNVTVVPHGPLSYLTVWPTGQNQPSVSTLNSFNGSVVANAAIVSSGTNGSLSLYATGETDLIIDVNGYFLASSPTNDQLNQTITQTNQQVAQQGSQLTQQNSQLTQLNSQISQQGSQFTQQAALVGTVNQQVTQINQQVTQQAATLTQQGTQLSQLTQQVTPLAQQLSQLSQEATQVSQQASQVNDALTQIKQQSSLLTSTNTELHLGTQGVQTKAYIAGISGTSIDIGDMVLVDQNGQLGTIQSSARYKENVQDLGTASEGIYQLRPVQFQYKRATADGQKPIQYGLIAEEVAQVYPELVVYNNKGEVETVQYQKLPALLLSEVQKQHRELEEQKESLRKAIETIQQLREQLQKLKGDSVPAAGKATVN